MRGFCRSQSQKRFYPHQKDGCLPTDLLDVSRCQRGKLLFSQLFILFFTKFLGKLPIIVSSANFLYAPEYVRNSIHGMERAPVQELDQIEIDVEPCIGAIIQANRRFMINIAMWEGQNLTIMPHDISHARNVIIPVLEIDERVGHSFFILISISVILFLF
jgi:hypothetical protein